MPPRGLEPLFCDLRERFTLSYPRNATLGRRSSSQWSDSNRRSPGYEPGGFVHFPTLLRLAVLLSYGLASKNARANPGGVTARICARSGELDTLRM